MDDVSMGELARRLDEVLKIVRDQPSRGEYNEYQRHSEHRFTDLARDVEQERADRKAQVVEERTARQTAVTEERTAREAADKALGDRMDKTGTNWRTNLWQGVGVAVLLFGMAVNAWLALGGR